MLESRERPSPITFKELNNAFGNFYFDSLNLLANQNLTPEHKDQQIKLLLEQAPKQIRSYLESGIKSVLQSSEKNQGFFQAQAEAKKTKNTYEFRHKHAIEWLITVSQYRGPREDYQDFVNELLQLTVFEELVPGIVNLHLTKEARSMLEAKTHYKFDGEGGKCIVVKVFSSTQFSFLSSNEHGASSEKSKIITTMHELSHFVYNSINEYTNLRTSTEENSALAKVFTAAKDELLAYTISATMDVDFEFAHLKTANLLPVGYDLDLNAITYLDQIKNILHSSLRMLRSSNQSPLGLLYPIFTSRNLNELVRKLDLLGIRISEVDIVPQNSDYRQERVSRMIETPIPKPELLKPGYQFRKKMIPPMEPYMKDVPILDAVAKPNKEIPSNLLEAIKKLFVNE